MAYYEICNNVNNKGWEVVQDEQGRIGPYAFKDRQWVGYDDIGMIRLKSEYIRKMGFGGGMVWALDLDDFTNRYEYILDIQGQNFGINPFQTFKKNEAVRFFGSLVC